MSDDAIAAAADAASANETVAPTPTPVTIIEQKAPTVDDTMEAVWEKLNATEPPRAPDGKFTKAESAEPATAEPAADATAEATETPDQPEEAQVEPAQPAIDAPHSWSGEHKAKWATVPPELQAYIAQRETESHGAITRAGQQLKTFEQQVKSYEPFNQLIQHYQPDFAKRGISPVQSFASLLAAQKSLEQNPLGGLVQIGLSYGVDLRPYLQAASQQHGGQPAQQFDPMVAQLQAQLSELQGKMTARERVEFEANQRAEQAKQEAERETHDKTLVVIEDFSKDKPYFNEVETELLGLIPAFKTRHPEASPKEILTKAYDAAIHANDLIRQRIQADQRKAEEVKRQADIKAKAESARKTAATNVKSVPGKTTPRTIDDTMEETWARLQAS